MTAKLAAIFRNSQIVVNRQMPVFWLVRGRIVPMSGVAVFMPALKRKIPFRARRNSRQEHQCGASGGGLTIHSSRRRFAARLNSGVRLAMNRFAKVAAIVAILIAAAMFVTPFILYFGIIAGTIAAVLKHDRHTR